MRKNLKLISEDDLLDHATVHPDHELLWGPHVFLEMRWWSLPGGQVLELEV